ncbi:MAG: hypothetical protein ACODAE_08845 [Gemmatimonadota bacterium]
MMTWLVALCVFPVVASLYLGGSAIRFEGGSGPRETLGLVLSFVLFLVVYGVGRAVFASFLGAGASIVLAALAAALLHPPCARLAFRLVGVRMVGRARDAVGAH